MGIQALTKHISCFRLILFAFPRKFQLKLNRCRYNSNSSLETLHSLRLRIIDDSESFYPKLYGFLTTEWDFRNVSYGIRCQSKVSLLSIGFYSQMVPHV